MIFSKLKLSSIYTISNLLWYESVFLYNSSCFSYIVGVAYLFGKDITSGFKYALLPIQTKLIGSLLFLLILTIFSIASLKALVIKSQVVFLLSTHSILFAIKTFPFLFNGQKAAISPNLSYIIKDDDIICVDGNKLEYSLNEQCEIDYVSSA